MENYRNYQSTRAEVAERSAKLHSLSEIARSQHSQLVRFIMRRVNDPTEAEEIAQQSFIEALECIDNFRQQSSMRTWLFGIAVNLANNHLRRAPARRYCFVPIDEVEAAIEPVACFDKALERQNLLRRISIHFDALPVEMQETVSLVLTDDASYEEAAERLSIPIGTVRSRISRARGILKEQMRAEGIEELQS